MNTTKQSTRSTRAVVVGGVLSLSLTGCLTVGQMAPPVDPDFTRLATGTGVSRATLDVGREVYISDCARCHTIEPISRYTADRWNDIISRMGARSKLDETRAEALRAYVLTAHQVLADRATAN